MHGLFGVGRVLDFDRLCQGHHVSLACTELLQIDTRWRFHTWVHQGHRLPSGQMANRARRGLRLTRVQDAAPVSLSIPHLRQRSRSTRVTLKEIRSDLFDAYVYIQTRLNEAVQKSRPGSPKVDTTRCAVTGGSAGGSATMWLASSLSQSSRCHHRLTHPEQCADVARYNATASDLLPRLKAALPAYCSILPNAAKGPPRSHIYSVKDDFGPERFALVEELFREKVCCSDPYQFNVL